MSDDRPPEDGSQGEPGSQWTLEDRDKAREKFNDARIEFAKLHYDWLKHLTTLCTGSILVISALSGSIFSDSFVLWRWLIPVSLVLLLLAVSEHAELAETTHAWLATLRQHIAEVEEDTQEAFRTRMQLVRLLVGGSR